MADKKQLEILEQGVAVWNSWRENNPKVKIDLSNANLIDHKLDDINLSNADLKEAYLQGASLKRAQLEKSDLSDAHLEILNRSDMYPPETIEEQGLSEYEHTNLFEANLTKAKFINANLKGANLEGVTAIKSNFSYANLDYTEFMDANLQNANLSFANIVKASFLNANLRNVNFLMATIDNSQLNMTDLRGTNLQMTTLINTDISKTQFDDNMSCQNINMRGCYGSQRLIRHINDLDFIEETKERYPVKHRLWHLTSNCGRSISRWAALSISFALFFGIIFADYHVWSWLPDWIQSILISLDPTMHYSTELKLSWFTPYYFSIVTFTTLGFGDVTPTNTAGQLWLAIEVIIGYIMLGGLLTLFATNMTRQGS